MILDFKALRDMNFKAVWWFIPIIFVELFAFYGMDNICGYGLPFESLYGFGNLIIIGIFSITLILMSSILFHHKSKTPSASFEECTSHSKNAVLFNKLLVGAYIIVSVFFMAYVSFNIILINQFAWKTYFFDLTIWTVTTMLMYLSIFSFIMMVQSVCNSKLFGIIMTILVTALPFVIMALVFSQYCRYNLQGADGLDGIPIFPGILPKAFLEETIHSAFMLILAFLGLGSKVSSFHSVYYNSYSFINNSPPYDTVLGDPFYRSEAFNFIRCVVYIILIIVFIYTSSTLYKKNMEGETDRLTGIVWIEKLFKLIISFYLGCLMLYLVASSLGFIRLDMIVVFTLIMPVLLYKFVISKAEKLFIKAGEV